MDKPIPDEIMQEARRLADLSSFPDADAAIAGIAHALLAERERAAKIAEQTAKRDYSASYRCGAADAATAIRAMEVKP